MLFNCCRSEQAWSKLSKTATYSVHSIQNLKFARHFQPTFLARPLVYICCSTPSLDSIKICVLMKPCFMPIFVVTEVEFVKYGARAKQCLKGFSIDNQVAE